MVVVNTFSRGKHGRRLLPVGGVPGVGPQAADLPVRWRPLSGTDPSVVSIPTVWPESMGFALPLMGGRCGYEVRPMAGVSPGAHP